MDPDDEALSGTGEIVPCLCLTGLLPGLTYSRGISTGISIRIWGLGKGAGGGHWPLSITKKDNIEI